MDSLNSIALKKYGHPPEETEVKTVKDDKIQEIYNFCTLVKVNEWKKIERNDLKKGELKKRKLRESLNIEEKKQICFKY